MDYKTLLSISILIVGLICIPVYYSTKSYFSKNGVILIFLILLLTLLRFSLIKDIPCRLYNKETILISITILVIPSIIFLVISLIKSKLFLGKQEYFLKLLIPYILFGALQQTLFQFVLADALLYLTNNTLITLLFCVIFFYLFHAKWPKTEFKKFFPLLILFSVINSYIYIFRKLNTSTHTTWINGNSSICDLLFYESIR